jgi:hypothetical protein
VSRTKLEWLGVFLSLVTLVSVVGCGGERREESTSERAVEAVEEAGDEVEEAADDVEDAVD